LLIKNEQVAATFNTVDNQAFSHSIRLLGLSPMSDSFNPYHKWLAIPPEEQPPHHYRLLGVRVLEDDLDVIETAADQKMVHLRTFHTGDRAKLAQRLLNEISSAKVCLLNPDKKEAYDAKLKEELSEAAKPKARAAAPSSCRTECTYV
jgi:hypothetical protein